MTPQQKWNSDVVHSLVVEHGLNLYAVQPYHLRISGGKFQGKLDYFPKSGRATIVGSQEWFVIDNIEQYIFEKFVK